MKLTVIGKYGPYPKVGGCTSGYLLAEGKTNVAFEMGAGVFERLNSIVAVEGLSAVIISHYHYDHVSDLGVLNYYLEALYNRGLLKGKLRLILPDCDSSLLESIKSMRFFEFDFVKDGDVRTVDGLQFEFFKVNHPVYALGFKVKGDKTFLYSSDTDVFDGLLGKLRDVDMALLDGAFLSSQYREGGPHMSAEICSNITLGKVGRCIISHAIPTNNELDYLAEIDEHCVLAQEGDTYLL